MKQYTAERDPETGFGKVVYRPGWAALRDERTSPRKASPPQQTISPAKGAAGNRAKYA